MPALALLTACLVLAAPDGTKPNAIDASSTASRNVPSTLKSVPSESTGQRVKRAALHGGITAVATAGLAHLGCQMVDCGIGEAFWPYVFVPMGAAGGLLTGLRKLPPTTEAPKTADAYQVLPMLALYLPTLMISDRFVAGLVEPKECGGGWGGCNSSFPPFGRDDDAFVGTLGFSLTAGLLTSTIFEVSRPRSHSKRFNLKRLAITVASSTAGGLLGTYATTWDQRLSENLLFPQLAIGLMGGAYVGNWVFEQFGP